MVLTMDALLLGEIKGKVDLILKALEQQKSDHDKIEERVTAIESHLKWATGIVSTVMFFFTFTSDYILTKLGLK